MKTTHWTATTGILTLAVLIIATAITAFSQIAPVLTIKPMGTSQFSVGFTNVIGTASYDVQVTPMLANPDYPWTWAAIGTPGQTNFLINSPYSAGFYRAILDTNAIPLWEAANPNDPALGALSITIVTPANGSTLN